jgi:site-specific DNA-methyltransferase (adenine-specific)
VAKSYARFGQRKPIVARRVADGLGEVVAGNHQLEAARSLGWDSIAVVWVDDDDLTAKAFALADNRTADLGTYDRVALAAMLKQVAADSELLAASSYTEADLAELLGLDVGGVQLTDPDEVPDAPPATTVRGDVWLLGEHRVLCGDSTDPAAFETVMAGGLADMVWTDPPYGVSYVGKTADALTIENDALDPEELEAFLSSALSGAASVCQPGAAWFVAAPAGPLFLAFGAVLAGLGIWRQTLVWLKDSLVMGQSDYHYRHEPLFYGWVPGAAHREPPTRTFDTVWEFPRPKVSTVHPTMKPVALIEQAIANHTKPGAVVLDPFGGSGSTLIAAQIRGRRARLIELSPSYCDVICRRFEAHTGIVPVAESTGREHSFVEVG